MAVAHPLRILLCPDTFKGSLAAAEVCHAAAAGLRRALPDATITSMPMADGGEGLLDVMVAARDVELLEETVHDPLGRPVRAAWGLSRDGRRAYVEMARASGLGLVAPDVSSSLAASSTGTGELIRCALERGVDEVLLGIGGSATTDAGTGMATALGARFLDADGQAVAAHGGTLARIARIDLDGLHPRLAEVRVTVATDVRHPLHGPEGAARVFAPQKGADAAAVAQLDAGLAHFAALAMQTFGTDVQAIPGAGAAGGLGAGAVLFLGATLVSGIEYVMAATDLDALIRASDVVVTGEGRLDRQSLGGKLVGGIAAAARAQGRPVAVLCGECTLDASQLAAAGIRWCTALVDGDCTREQAMAHAGPLLETRAAHLGRTLAGAIT